MATANQLGLNALQYIGEREIRCTIQSRPPTIADNKNFRLNDFWIVDDPTNAVVDDRLQLWVLLSLREGDADWFRFDLGGGINANEFPTDNGTAFPTALGVLNVVGDGTYIDTDALVANTITINLTDGGQFTKQYDTDSGSAVPIANVIQILGGDNINTAGATNVVQVNVDRSIRLPNTTADGLNGVYYTGAVGAVGTKLTGGQTFLHQYGTANTFLGEDAGNLTLTTGTAQDNIGIGYAALTDLTTAARNVVIGSEAGTLMQDSDDNVLIGHNSGASIISADNNVFIGSGAGASATTLTEAVLIGKNAGTNLTIANPTAGSEAIAIGFEALGSAAGNTAGQQCLAIGWKALTTHTIAGGGHTAVGHQALRDFDNADETSFPYNTAVGFGSMASWTSGKRNTALGARSIQQSGAASSGSGSYNTAVGAFTMNPTAGSLTVTSAYNVCIGDSAGQNFTTSESSNIIIGTTGSDIASTGDNNTTIIGGGTGTGNGQQNKCFISGIRGITTANADAIAVLVDSANQLGTVSSARKFKEDIQDMDSASSFIYKLRPRTFHFKDNPKDTVSPGLIAEEVEEVSPWLVAYDSDKKPFSVKYHELPTLLLNELQKLKREVMELRDELSLLRSRG